MIMFFLLKILPPLFISIGLIFCSIGMIGVIKMKDVYTKQHCASLIDSAGIFFICIGLSLASGFTLVSFKPLLLGVLVVLMSSPICYAFMQIALHFDKKILQQESNKNG